MNTKAPSVVPVSLYDNQMLIETVNTQPNGTWSARVPLPTQGPHDLIAISGATPSSKYAIMKTSALVEDFEHFDIGWLKQNVPVTSPVTLTLVTLKNGVATITTSAGIGMSGKMLHLFHGAIEIVPNNPARKVTFQKHPHQVLNAYARYFDHENKLLGEIKIYEGMNKVEFTGEVLISTITLSCDRPSSGNFEMLLDNFLFE